MVDACFDQIVIYNTKNIDRVLYLVVRDEFSTRDIFSEVFNITDDTSLIGVKFNMPMICQSEAMMKEMTRMKQESMRFREIICNASLSTDNNDTTYMSHSHGGYCLTPSSLNGRIEISSGNILAEDHFVADIGLFSFLSNFLPFGSSVLDVGAGQGSYKGNFHGT